MKRASAANRVSPRLFWLASLMFFLSGGTGLVYQVIWFKRFAHVWGSSSLAFASVGGSFLFGLGAGAWLIGRYADHVPRPLRWYGACELAIGVAALVMPFEIRWLIELAAGLYSYLPNEPLWRYLVQFCLTLAVVGPPCVLMGGTLPLLIRELTARDGALDQATAWLYAINTFGAATGCYLAGFQLLPSIGLLWTNNITAALNTAIGLAAVLVSTQAPARNTERAAALISNSVSVRGTSVIMLYMAAGLSGLAALILEMTWSRQLALVLGGSTYAYSATLFVILVGMAAGSLVFHLGLRRVALAPCLAMIVIGALVGTCFLGKLLLPWLSTVVGNHRGMRQSLAGNAFLCVTASALVELLPSMAMGILFPLFVDLTREQASRVGRTVGNVYAWNTFGSIAGASLTPILLFPRIGTAGTLGLATALYVVTLLLVIPRHSSRDRMSAIFALAVGATLVCGISLPLDPLRTNMGDYIYGSREGILDLLNCPYFVEGASSNVLVVRHADGVTLRVNGKSDASDDQDMMTQLGLAYIPRIFCPHARDVLVIGFGSGTTPGASLLFPQTQVTCCEIEPAVYGASSFFNHVNHRPHERERQFVERANASLPSDRRLNEEQINERARLRMVFGDGRTELQGGSRTYDLIISEPSNPWMAGVSNLFTQEFFQAAKAHLKPGGVLAQWIQTYQFTLSDYLMIVRTMRTAFPHCGLMFLTMGYDTLLLASDKPLLPDREGLEEMQRSVDASTEITADLLKWFNTSDLRILLLSRYTADQESLDDLVAKDGAQRVNTDLNLRLEFDAPLHLFQELPPAASAQVQLAGLSSSRWRGRLATALGVSTDGPDYRMAQMFEHLHLGQIDAALSPLREAVVMKPSFAAAYGGIADAYFKQGKPQEAFAALREWVKSQPDDLEPRAALVDAYVSAGRHEEAVDALTSALQRDPTNASLHALLAQELVVVARTAEAVAHFRKALDLNPQIADDPRNLMWVNNYARLLATNPDPGLRNGAEAIRWAEKVCKATNFERWEAIDTLAAGYAEAGRFDEAANCVQQILQHLQATGDAKAVEVVRPRLALYRSGQPLRDQAGAATPASK